MSMMNWVGGGGEVEMFATPDWEVSDCWVVLLSLDGYGVGGVLKFIYISYLLIYSSVWNLPS